MLFQGESFYNPYIPRVLEELNNKGLIVESEGARVIFIEGQPIPFIVVKSDGGFNYASTDLSALWLVILTVWVDALQLSFCFCNIRWACYYAWDEFSFAAISDCRCFSIILVVFLLAYL